MNTYRDLIVWQKAMKLVTDVYIVTSAFPKEEMFSITSQIKRSAISVSSNLSEGFGRHYTREFIRKM